MSRADLTVTAVEQSRDSSLEEALDDSAALRIIQWKSFPSFFLASPIWGTGLGTFADRLRQEQASIDRLTPPWCRLERKWAGLDCLDISAC